MNEPRHSHASIGLLSAAIVLILALAVCTATGRANSSRGIASQRATRHVVRCTSVHTTPDEAIVCVWPMRLRAQALRVAECESTASASERVARRRGLGRWASDYGSHTHIGVFELGADERRVYGRYGIGSSAMRQVRSAYRLYQARGWQPWRSSQSCWGR